MKDWSIENVSGDVLYEGKSNTKKEFIQSLVDNKYSLAGAVLRDLDLSHINFDEADLSGADLSGSSLRGVTANRAKFDNAILDGVRAEGMTARKASFKNARIESYKGNRENRINSTFDGSVFTHANFEAAKIKNASFEGAYLSGASLAMAQILRCQFTESHIGNADWTRCQIMHSDFARADLQAKTTASRIPHSSMPNRTADALAVGNDLTDAILDHTVPAFKRDRIFSRIDNNLAWAVSTAAIIAGAAFLPDTNGDWLANWVGQGTMLIGAISLISLLKEKAQEFVQENLADLTLKAQLAVRTSITDLIKRGSNIKEIAAVLTRGPGLRAVTQALAATSQEQTTKGKFSVYSTLVIGGADVVLCDKSHLAKAIEWISTTFNKTKVLDRDMIVSRVNSAGSEAPSILKFFANGGMAAFWVKDGVINRTIAWTADEMTVDFAEGDFHGIPSAIEIRRDFERAMIADHLPQVRLEYDTSSQHIRAGMDGSLVVVNMIDQLPYNRIGPVMVRKNGNQYSVKEAKELQGIEDDKPNSPGMA